MPAKRAKPPAVPTPAPPQGSPQKSAEDWLADARTARKRGDLFKARDCFEMTVELAPRNIPAWFEYGELKEYMGNNPPGIMAQVDLWMDAVQKFQRVVALQPEHADAWAHLGYNEVHLAEWARDVDKRSQHYASALEHIERAINYDKNHAGAWFARGLVHSRLEHREQALASFTETVKHNPANKTAWFNCGVLHELLNHLPDALACFQEVQKLDPNDQEARDRVMQVEVRLGTPNAGLKGSEVEKKAIDDLLVGQRLVKQSNFPKAIQFLSASEESFGKIANERGLVEAGLYLALAHKGLRQYGQVAASLWKVYVRVRQGNDQSLIADVTHNLGFVEFQLKNFPQAVELLTNAAKLFYALGAQAKEADSRMNLGKALLALGEPQRALENFSVSFTIDLDLKQSYKQVQDISGMGDACAALGQISKAREHYRKALALCKTSHFRQLNSDITAKLTQLGSRKTPA